MNTFPQLPAAKSLFTALLLSLIVAVSASSQPAGKFSDPVIRTIHDLADRRDAAGLMPYLRAVDPNHRGEALFCLGSVQAVGISDSILAAVRVEQERVRMMGAWALGQSGDPAAAVAIWKMLVEEKSQLVRGMCFEALGRVGTMDDLDSVAAFDCQLQETEGQAAGILRFGLRGITSVKGNQRIVRIMNDGSSTTGMIYASYYLGRYAGMDWLQTVPAEIDNLYNQERDQEVKSNLIKAVIRAKDEEAWPLAKSILESDQDYRIKVNVLNSMALIPWNKASKLVYGIVKGADPNLSVAAAEAVQRHAVYTDLPLLLPCIDQTANWRSRSLLLGKALELVAGKGSLTNKVAKQIIASVEQSSTPARRAWYLKALSADPARYVFVEKQLNEARDPAVASAAIETLAEMRKGKQFEAAAKEMQASGINLEEEFLRIFLKAIQTGDVTLVAVAAGVLRDPALNYRGKITDISFLESAREKMIHPSKIEAYVELCQTIAWLKGMEAVRVGPPVFNHPIDWETVQGLDSKQAVLVRTSKGDFVIRLNVTWCPATSAAFAELIRSGFYRNFSIHRVVPNFVMQDGCPRGDGWGGPDFSIRSEFTPTPFLEGTIGMASSGRDTEGSQWYATHSSTPHLDGRYTPFGFVAEGMEVVHKLEVGDLIIGMELISQKD